MQTSKSTTQAEERLREIQAAYDARPKPAEPKQLAAPPTPAKATADSAPKLTCSAPRPVKPPLPEGCVRLEGCQPMFAPPNKLRQLEGIDAKHRSAIRAVVEGKAPWPLLLTGEAGSGKTCAALCMIDAFGGWYLTVTQLTEMLIAAQQGRLQWSSGYARTVEEIWTAWERAHLTVLDELGGRKVSDFHYETVKRCLDLREGRPAVFISNLDIDHLIGPELYDDRIASRLAGGSVIETTGDRRVERELQVHL